MRSSEVPPTPDTVPCRANSSRTVTLSSRVLSSTTQLGGLGQPKRQNPPSASLGVSFPFSVCGTREPAEPGFASPGTFRSQGFAPSQRLTSPSPSRVSFTPERSWDSPFRASLLRRSRSASRRPLPSCCYSWRHSGVTPAASPPRRRTRREASFRVLLPFEVRANRQGV